MALDSTKFVMEGPATVTFKDSATPKLTLTSIENENVKMEAREEGVEKKRADGSKSYSRGGKEIIVTAVFDELKPADMDAIEATDNMTIAFSNTGKTVTIGTIDLAHAAVADGKTSVTALASAAVGTDWSDIFTVA